jgi:hypothetical protein
MSAPIAFTPKFIGKLIRLQREHRDNLAIKEHLCIAVGQCRNYNRMSPEERQAFLPEMVAIQQGLARLGVVVG